MADTARIETRGRKPQDPEHGPMTPGERSARRRALLTQQAQAAIDRPSEAHTLPTVALVRALSAQLAQIDTDPMASRHPAAALVVELVTRYRLPVDIALPVQIDTSMDAGATV